MGCEIIVKYSSLEFLYKHFAMHVNEQNLEDFKSLLINDNIKEARRISASQQNTFRNELKVKPPKDLPCDDFTTCLIPDNVSRARGDCLFALKASPNGDCLFNAFSILLCGNESLAVPPRLLVAGELYFNASFYANHDAFNETATNSTDLTVDILSSIALSKAGDKKLLETGIKSEAVKTETLVVYQTRMVFIHTYPGSRLCGFKANTFCLS